MLAAMQAARDAARAVRLEVKQREMYARMGRDASALHKDARQLGLRVQTAREFVQTYKANKPCLDCLQVFPPYCLDFDHVRGKKDRDISTLVHQGRNILRIQHEIEKCDLVCANCHRIRTFSRKK
jgi:hypothetical protein